MIKEFREFFLRHLAVTVGTKPDQEVGFATQYAVMIGGVSTLKYNRFLAGDYPSEAVFAKLFESLAFKLNPEDRATDSAQGLIRLATYLESIGHRDTGGALIFSNGVRPSHLPQVDTVLRTSDTLVATTGDVDGLTNVITAVADTSQLSYGDPIKGTGIPVGAFVTGLTANTITLNVATTIAGAGVALSVDNTVTGIRIRKVVRTDGTFSRTVYVVTIDAATLPITFTLAAQTFAPAPADPTCPAAGGAVYFDVDDTLDGTYLVHTHYTLAPVTGTTFSTLSGLAIDGAFEATGAISGGLTTGAGVDNHPRSHTNVIVITAGEMLQIGVNVPNDGTDSLIGNIYVTVTKLDN